MGVRKRSGRRITYLDLKLKSKDAHGNDIPVAWFHQTEKQGDKYVTVDQFDAIEGYLVKFEPVEFKYTQGGRERTGKKMNIHMYDPGEAMMYEVSFGYTSIWRSLINSLYSAHKDKIGWIVIEVFVYKDNPMIKVYKESADKENELRWAVSWDGQKKYIGTKRGQGGEEEPDYYQLNEKFIGISQNELTDMINNSYDIADLTKDWNKEDTRTKKYADSGTVHVDDLDDNNAYSDTDKSQEEPPPPNEEPQFSDDDGVNDLPF